MGAKTNIEWTDASWTPVRSRFIEIQSDGSGKERIGWHCTHVSEGCRNCYAESLNRRLGTGQDYKPSVLYRAENKGHNNGEVHVFLDEKMLRAPMAWRRPRMIFVCSMTDLFADFVPDSYIDQMLAIAALCPRHTFQVLTKRPERMRLYFEDGFAPEGGSEWQHRVCAAIEHLMPTTTDETRAAMYRVQAGPLPNVWLGTSVEDQPTAIARIPDLLMTPAAIRFISAEPLLGSVDLTSLRNTHGDLGEGHPWLNAIGGFVYETGGDVCGAPKLDWIIVGGESGPDARPMHPEWVRLLQLHCEIAGTAFFFKQWGAWAPQGRSDRMMKVGKGAAGRILDGKTYSAFPGAAT